MLRFGISIDLDVLDPLEESDFGSPESGGVPKNILVDMHVTHNFETKTVSDVIKSKSIERTYCPKKSEPTVCMYGLFFRFPS